jgi:Amt family ammonium transporter
MGEMGALDFAGGNVVHINAGVAGLVLFLVLGKRVGYGKEAMFPSSIDPDRPGRGPAVVRLVRFQRGQPAGRRRGGRIGISGHQHLGRHGSPGVDVLRMDRHRQTTVLGIASGVVAGLVAITPAAGFVNLPVFTDHRPGFRAYWAFFVAVLKHKIGYDDSLDAFGVHGMCGIWGALATGLFANPAITEGCRRLVLRQPRAAVDPGRLHRGHTAALPQWGP